MFRRPRQTTADGLSLRLSKILHPIPVIPWSALAMWYLGVPVGVGAPMIVVRDAANYPTAQSRLAKAGFKRSVPNRNPHPQQMLGGINAGYHRVDRSCAVFDYRDDDPSDKAMQLYLYLFPNLFAHVFDGWRWQEAPRHETAQRYESYGNLHYALERALVGSLVRAAVEEESATGFSAWGEDLRSCVAMMNGYLEVDNDALDYCADEQVVDWYSRNFGRIREARFGPMDHRVSKRLGSGREMPVDTRGNPI
ncbi:uncharacterized protein BO66DRAFT_459671 [Aspergillus aculeatinus CBS 121060]|uniref:Uncharacterized protein n=1 Tax=Aspergillus aculeatinus CBS 121060 TaxID=1448322 RepID=A0ACD1HK62_9EURO|nr:hypothetical protein BO66DRAFT_459671 [Aspergillus aculeatinus CBS 121060]RAH73950.1 hypothetical protein BO66DRAFT_459671 [Aspergillus aculeatinus CBS 121060]